MNFCFKMRVIRPKSTQGVHFSLCLGHMINMILLTMLIVGTLFAIPSLFYGIQVLYPKEPENYRLPNATIPLHYDINLTTNVHTGERAFAGTVKIDLKVNEDTEEIVLHARQLEDFVASCRLTNSHFEDEEEEELEVSYEEDFEFLRLMPKNSGLTFKKNSLWTVTVHYKGELRNDLKGFYLSEYEKDVKKRYLASTQFEYMDARHAFPCYDEPSKRARFTVTINHDPTYHALSNMPVNEPKSKPGTTVFLTSVSMPTYLVAFVVSDFQFTEKTENSLRHRVYSSPGTENMQEWALNNSLKILRLFEEYCGIEFPLPKLDQLAVPDMWPLAMENWGLVLYKEDALLVDPTSNNTNGKSSVAHIIAHEYAHQWFGNLVTAKYWTYLWLNEGFATLFATHIADMAHPEFNFYQTFKYEVQNALETDRNSREPMTYYPPNAKQAERRDTKIVYKKAAGVLHMFRHALGDKVFQQGLRNYLVANQYDAVDEQQLFDALQKAVTDANSSVPASITDIMSSWTQQSGHPVLMVTRNYNDGSFTVSQQPFQSSQTDDKLWHVPFNYVSKTNADYNDTRATHYLLKVPEMQVEAQLSGKELLLLNKQGTGFYHVNYDERNWELISSDLRTNHESIHVYNRMHLLMDVNYFSGIGELSQKMLLDLLTYLRSEDKYGPWSVASNIIDTLHRQLGTAEDQQIFKRFVRALVTPLYAKLGTTASDEESLTQKKVRGVAMKIACEAGLEDCLENTRARLQAFIENGTSIERELQWVVLCQGLKQSEKEEDFEYIYNAMQQTEKSDLRSAYISALACAGSEPQLKQLLASAIDESNSLADQDRVTILNEVYRASEVGFMLGIEFLQQNLQKYIDLTAKVNEGNTYDNIIREMATLVTNVEQGNQLLMLLMEIGDDTDDLEDDVRSAMETSMQSYSLRQNELTEAFKMFDETQALNEAD